MREQKADMRTDREKIIAESALEKTALAFQQAKARWAALMHAGQKKTNTRERERERTGIEREYKHTHIEIVKEKERERER